MPWAAQLKKLDLASTNTEGRASFQHFSLFGPVRLRMFLRCFYAIVKPCNTLPFFLNHQATLVKPCGISSTLRAPTSMTAAASPVRNIIHLSFTDQPALTKSNVIFYKCCSLNCLLVTTGTFTGTIVRLVSDIRAKHGKGALRLKGCGRFVLADNLSDIAEITHVDLSGISSLEGGCPFLKNNWTSPFKLSANVPYNRRHRRAQQLDQGHVHQHGAHKRYR